MLSMPKPRFVAHPVDGKAIELHPVGMTSTAHSHEIVEDWSFEKKQAAGAHIDAWHFPKPKVPIDQEIKGHP